ncbi:TetR/AcrR family transcriptional regulator [Ktedonobacter racemifer]|uniref:Transcriptional regulator, TetR family n=1 Tax=Ktedonobacter racemifer DSM 44963 TaxID=485913 RepID=D6TPZ4_KTERA|nr:TetR/AcrR family transcriptional regulator [Ktedonobacter racemifer]EFH87579.1 transcriptional regulator, TetR family [Ktedonobacter racemifer DSM 44963]
MPRGQRRSSTGEDIEETRNTILRTAHQLFMEYGFRAVSTRQIADACGLTQPALYHYFSDKQDLYFAVVKESIAKSRAGLERIAHRNESVPERLRLVARFLVSTNRIDIGMMLHDIEHELHARARADLYQEFHAGMLMPIASIFEDGIRQGFLCNEQTYGVDALMATDLFMNMLKRFILRAPRLSSAGFEASPSLPETSYQPNYLEQAEQVVPVLLFGLASRKVDANLALPPIHPSEGLVSEAEEPAQ